MNRFENYFNENFKHLKVETKNIDELLKDGELYIISGDFYGIQKFIFDGLSSKNAAKILRAKSAFIQLFTEYITKYICKKLGIDEKAILSVTAGKFEIITSSFSESVLKDIQKNINDYFIKNFFGLSGMNLCFVKCTKDDFKQSLKYKNLREKISKEIEKSKFKKFDLINQNSVLNYDSTINNQTLCKLCNFRKIKKEHCEVCEYFVKLGQKLTTSKIDELIISDEFGIQIDSFVCDLVLDEKIKSYVARDNENRILEFEVLSKNSLGVNAIAVLKADVDNMGNFLKNSDVTNSFENFELFSKTMDSFFSLHIPRIMQEKFKNSYTVFAGGDDLFLLGSWNTILEFARFIEKEFKSFIKNKDLTISFGISLAKASTPINYLANYTEELLSNAKAIDDKKDAITLFDETVKWQSYKEVFEKLMPTLENLKIEDDKTTFFYRLLDFCQMSKDVINGDIKATIWKSKLNYVFSRNMKNIDTKVLNVLNHSIENAPKETKIVLCEFIYKRRK
ncbi:MAG: hypothetical protein M0O97_06680 [Arcobacteraceae bacterium]|nr:hypothetical protein [Arcobacteraceae bacterium]